MRDGPGRSTEPRSQPYLAAQAAAARGPLRLRFASARACAAGLRLPTGSRTQTPSQGSSLAPAVRTSRINAARGTGRRTKWPPGGAAPGQCSARAAQAGGRSGDQAKWLSGGAAPGQHRPAGEVPIGRRGGRLMRARGRGGMLANALPRAGRRGEPQIRPRLPRYGSADGAETSARRERRTAAAARTRRLEHRYSRVGGERRPRWRRGNRRGRGRPCRLRWG